MNETIESEVDKKATAPFYIFLICLIGILGLIAVVTGYFTSFHSMVGPVGWGCFLGANLILILHAIFRKKRSDIMGEFHAYNLVAGMVSLMVTVTIGLLFGLVMFAWSYLSEVPKTNVYGLVRIGGLVLGLQIAYGWIRWFAANR